MSDNQRTPGKTTVSIAVLTEIAHMAALGVPGVEALGVGPAGGRMFRRMKSPGVRLMLQDNLISGDLYVVIKGDQNIREVGREVQLQVARAIQEMVGMAVTRLDVHVEDIVYESSKS
jgi:uncharacterized alkaline shock family protein YloU